MAKGKKTGGRQAGTPNHVTTETRELFRAFISTNMATVQATYDEARAVDPVGALRALAAFAEFCVPKLARTEMVGEGGGPLVVKVMTYGAESKETPVA